jgi:hypothetical protein
MQNLCPNLFYLPGKSQATYTRFFTLIKDKIADSGLVFSPTSAMTDFETAVHNSIRDVFPDINTEGCFFHFTQSIWRKAQATGLQIPYHTETTTTSRRWFDEQQFYRLCFLHQFKTFGSRP